jgi:mRNA interferase MazF
MVARVCLNLLSKKSGTIRWMPIMTGYKRGSIVLLPFPFSDQTSAKIRPAIVVSPDYPSDDLLVVAVTSVGDGLRPGEFAIQFWREAGLIHPSFAKRAVASVTGNLARKKRDRLRESDLVKLGTALGL